MSLSKKLSKIQQDLEKVAPDLPLAESAKDIVHGEGSSDSEVMLIGEAPGFQEAKERRPFVGRSGQFLRKTLVEVGIKPAEVFISNIVKARPPENRDPTPAEINAYKPFLDAEILAIDPKLIVTLGRFSMAKFLPDVRISQVHGRLHRVTWQEKKLFVLPMYHPAAALRGTQVKNLFVQDLAKILKAVEWIKSKQADGASFGASFGVSVGASPSPSTGASQTNSKQPEQALVNQVKEALLD